MSNKEMIDETVQPTIADNIARIMEESKPDILASIRSQLQVSVTDSLSWSMRNHVDDVVKDFMQSDEMKAEIAVMLEEVRPKLIQELNNAITQVVVEVGKAMQKKAVESLTQSYNLKKVIEAVF